MEFGFIKEAFRTLVGVFKKYSDKFVVTFGKDSDELVGVDIQDSYVKLLKLSHADGADKVENFAIAGFPCTAIVNGEIINFSEMGKTIADVKYKANILTNTAAIAINGSLVTIKKISVYKSNNDFEIESQVWMEAEKIFPEMVGNINLDYQILKEDKQDNNKTNVLLIACRKDIIQSFNDVLQLGGFQPKVVDVNFYALERAFAILAKQLPNYDNSKTVAMLNIEGTIATFVVMRNWEIIYSTEQVINMKPIRNWLIYLLNDRNKCELNESVVKMKNAIALQALHILHFYSTRQNSRIDYFILSGEYATIPNIADAVKDKIGIGTFIANPFADMQFSESMNESQINKVAPAFTICCGLAKRGKQNV